MARDFLAKSFHQKVALKYTLAAGIGLLLGAHAMTSWIQNEATLAAIKLRRLNKSQEQLSLALANSLTLTDLKSRDIARFKTALSELVQSKRSLYEAGLSLQEEKRLLEKQWEMMTTYLMLDEQTHRILLMRGDQALKSYPVSYAPPKDFGKSAKPIPLIGRIVSKERFAHPERGTSEMVDGKLQWNPPQVGTSVRANALGEYVLFTQSGLILHGPPKKSVEHESFPHLCLGLSLSTARDLYRNCTIGTKILLATSKTEETR